MINNDDSLNGFIFYSPLDNESFLGNEESFILKGEDIDKNQEKNESNSNYDSTKGTFPKENNEKVIKSGKIQKKEHKNMGRKTKNSQSTGPHNKYMFDNLRRKIKHLFIKILREFINEKIKEKYQKFIGKGVFIKQLLVVNQEKIDDARVLSNKELLEKSIGDILSENISTRYTKYPLFHNKKLIDFLKKNEQDINRNNYSNKLFNLSFKDALNHFRESNNIEVLKGMKTFNSIKQDLKDKEEDYIKMLDYFIQNYEIILYNQRIREQKKREINIEDNKNQ